MVVLAAAENGDIACDSYHKWEEDVANAKALGLDYYRWKNYVKKHCVEQ